MTAVAESPGARWRSASARADRVLVAAMAALIGMAGAMLGSALPKSPATVRSTQLANRIVEYVRVPALSEPDSQNRQSEGAKAQLLVQHRCLAEAMYYEARSEGEKGELAVAEVIFHRLQNGGYGRSICAVVYKGAPRAGCQFSFACDGSLSRPKSPEDWRTSEALAARILMGELLLGDATDNATNYHAVYVHPAWAAKSIQTAQIGNHIFYRPRGILPIASSLRFFQR